MSTRRKSLLWTRGILLCSLLFTVWTVSLIVSANRVQTEVSGEVGLVNELNETEQSIRELDKAFTERKLNAVSDADGARWRKLYADYRARTSAFDPNRPEIQEIHQSLMKADALVARMDTLYAEALSTRLVGVERERTEAEFSEARRQAIDEVEGAVQAVRRRLVDYSLDLTAKWRYLNVLAVFSCLLAIFAALLLTARQRHRAERRSTEESLRASEERYRVVAESASDAIVTIDETNTILYVNGSAEKIFGYTVAELTGASLTMLMPDYLRRLHEVGMKRYAETGKKHISWTAVEVPGLHQSGREIPLEISFGESSKDGKRIFTGIVRDVSERKRAEEQLRKSEEYRNLFRHANDAILIFEPESEIVIDVNDRACEIYGFTRNELIGRSLKELSPDVTRGERHLEKLLGRGTYEAFETTQLRADGTPVAFLINSSVIEFQGRPAVLSINRDITERKQAEEALRLSEEQLRQSQKMESVGTLAGGVAHDFNNLLTAILGNTQLAMRLRQPDERLQSRLTEIEKAANRAATLTRQLLAFSRRQQLERKSLDLNETVADIMKMLRRIIGEDVEVRVLSTPGLAPVSADPAQIEQVVMNLAVNARDAMPGGGQLVIETHNVTLDENYCRRHAYAKPGRYARLMVSDTGCGMDAETRARIFEPFFTTKEVGKGTGLGLSMVYGIVKQHEGLIEVYSEVGRGTTFKIYLPVVEKAVQEETRDTLPALRGGRETILVAEDEEALRELAKDVLEDLGYEVLLAGDGGEAVQLVRDHRGEIDLLLLDVVMPRMGGREAYSQIRASGNDLPVIFMTGYSAEVIEQNFADGARVTLLQKPYGLEVIGRKVREVLDEAYVRG